MLKSLCAVLVVGIGLTVWSVGCQMSATTQVPGLTPEMSSAALSGHPAAQALGRLFPDPKAKPPKEFKPGKMKRQDYLTLVAGNVDFFKQHQNTEGAIIDPVKGEEVQYSTPAFALAAATLVAETKRPDLLDPAVRAMTFATHALANKTTANNHADFYTPMLIHARRILMPRVPKQTLAQWDADFKAIVPETHYHDADARGNWNIVNIDGESLRRKDGLVASDQSASQLAYIENNFEKQEARFTKFGMYTDPNMPLAYDAFPRMWMEDMMASSAYDGAHAQQIRDFLLLGGLSSMLILSPTGEWACGGRSADHQWNEAENIAIFEINANKWHQLGRDDIAGAMKRSAHLAYESMKRWQRPSGEMWIVKNRAEPAMRLGYEGYSSYSQYNLLPMAMLCMAFEHADDSIKERPAPCEVGGFVFDLREKFHKVFANAGGMYIEIDTAADPRYNATGLQRVQKKGVPLSPLSDSTAGRREYGPKDDETKIAMSPTMQWTTSPPTTRPVWHSMAEFVNPTEPKPEVGEGVVESVDLKVIGESPNSVELALLYRLRGEAEFTVEEGYTITPDQVDGMWHLVSSPELTDTRVMLPVLVNDGANDLRVETTRGTVEAHRDGGVMYFQVISPTNVLLRLEGPRVPNHNGYARAAVGEISRLKAPVVWRIMLDKDRR